MDNFNIGSYGIYPFMTEDVFKQIKYANIKTKAARIAYILSLGDKALKPEITEGVTYAKGALKFIKRVLDENDA